ncbi:sodium:phosphate symporter [Fulvitalea axinellae]|uniref:Sodium:phosphate symporter n=1 Tax=Fulvitalea axinellae TaxID=1182444 RepID=A0AAU9CT78_9BACT|nr:sodium:phosphate symporter [Fulvitalea axinellae]
MFKSSNITDRSSSVQLIGKLLMTAFILAFFVFSVELTTDAFEHLGKGTAQTILSVASNPFVGLFVGLLITALIQSSSTCTSMVIALVAANTLSVKDAIPIVMGANVGTTLTSTIVALGFLSEKKSFRKAISAAMLHDAFNILSVMILFPLELRYGILSNSAEWLAGMFSINKTTAIGAETHQSASDLTYYLRKWTGNEWIVLAISSIMLFSSIKLFSSFIYKKLISTPRILMQNLFFSSPWGSFAFGGALTGMVQSSSITTSFVVPLAATGKVSVKQTFPFVMGANVGTTITGFIAAYSQSEAALIIAIVHFLLNASGTLIFMPFPPLRQIPVRIAKNFGRLTLKNRLYGFAYIILTFFLIPFFLIYFSK